MKLTFFLFFFSSLINNMATFMLHLDVPDMEPHSERTPENWKLSWKMTWISVLWKLIKVNNYQKKNKARLTKPKYFFFVCLLFFFLIFILRQDHQG